MRLRFWKRQPATPVAPSTEAQIELKWTLEMQKFIACPRHSDLINPTTYEPYDPTCPDCVITVPPVLVDDPAVPPDIEAAARAALARREPR